jgi:hypothetical protein
MITGQAAFALGSKWVTDNTFISRNRSFVPSSLVALITITMISVNGTILWIDNTAYRMTGKAKGFINCPVAAMLTGYSSSDFIFAVAVAAEAGTTMQTCQTALARITRRVTPNALINIHLSPGRHTFMTLCTLIMCTVESSIFRIENSAQLMANQAKCLINLSPSPVIIGYGSGGCSISTVTVTGEAGTAMHIC